MRRLAAAFAAGTLLALRCASQVPEDAAHVRVTKDPAVVKPCIDLAKVKTTLDDQAGENDLKQQTADLGGNVLLVYNARDGGAFYCKNVSSTGIMIPAQPGTPAPGATPRP